MGAVLAAARLALVFAAGCAAGPGSIGAVLGRDNETRALHVRQVPGAGAAEAAGLAPGDEIVMIDGAYAKDLGADEIRKKLRGDAGSSVKLTVVRGDRVRQVEITRAPLRTERAPAPKEERIAE